MGVGKRVRAGGRLWGVMVVVVAAGAACARVRSGDGGAAANPPWLVARTPHFEVYAQLSAEDTDRMARFLEDARTALLTEAWKIDFRMPGAPIKVLAVRDLDRYGGPSTAEGSGNAARGLEPLGGSQAILVDIKPENEHFAGFVVLHEVVHALHEALGLTIPRWLNEGLASYFDAMILERERGVAAVGTVAGYEWQQFKRQPPLTLRELAVWNYDYWSPTYLQYAANAWFLVHYLMSEELDRFRELQRRLLAGQPWRRVWHDLFEIPGEPTIDERLAMYRAGKKYPHREVSVPFADWTLQPAAAVSPADRHVLRAVLYAGMISPLLDGERLRRLRAELDQAFRLDPASLLLAEMYLADLAPVRRKQVVRASWQAHPHDWRAAVLHAFTQTAPAAAATLEQAARRSPRQPYLEAALASAYLAMGRPAAALALAEQAARREPSDGYVFEVLTRARLAAAEPPGQRLPVAQWPTLEERLDRRVTGTVASHILRFHTHGLARCAGDTPAAGTSYRVTALITPDGRVGWDELEGELSGQPQPVDPCVRQAIEAARFPRRGTGYVVRGQTRIVDFPPERPSEPPPAAPGQPDASVDAGRPNFASNDIRQVMRSSQEDMLSCFAADLDVHPGTEATVVASFEIGADGQVRGYETAESSLQRPAVEACLAGVILDLAFPPATAGTGTLGVHYPMRFIFPR